MQALSRKHPDLPPAPGQDRRREFEYKRHGVVNLSLANVVTTGELHGYVLPGNNNSDNFIESLERLDYGLKDAKRIELILDNASSHTSAQTTEWFERHADRFRPHFTPKHASWLNQAELAISAFTRRYTRNRVVKNRDHLVDRIEAGLMEYNQRHAHPFAWSFTRHAMHEWYERHCQRISSTVN